MRRGYFYFFRIIIIIAVLYGLLRLLAFIPADRLAPFLTDKIVFLQTVERNIQQGFGDLTEVFNQTVLQRQRDRQFEQLYQKQLIDKSLTAALVYENNILRDALRFQRTYTGSLIPAEVIGRSGDQWFRFVTVSKGSAGGLRPAMMAINTDGLVGYVYENGTNSAKVILITDPLVNISCVNERTGEIYILTGKDLNRLELKYATLHSDIKVGDRLLTSGYSYRYKKGILVGSVSEVHLPKNSLSKKATVKPAANIAGLDILFFVR